MPNLVKQVLSQKDLKDIANSIAEAEGRTSGEIRVEVRQRRSKKERALSVEELARREFQHLGMTRTKERNGVLLFLLLEHRELHVLADEGIHQKVQPQTWQQIVDTMVSRFSKQEFRDGILDAVRRVGDLLAHHFPRTSADTNELPNDVRVR